MPDRRTVLCALSGAMVAASTNVLAAAPASDNAIRSLLGDEVDQLHISPGIVVGVLDSQGKRILAHGSDDSTAGKALDGDTVFDIGSLTKLFTALLITDMAARGEMRLGDSIAKYLPADVHVPDFGGRTITVQDLATYAPGLPDWPEDMAPLSAEKPFPDYSVMQLYASLSGRKLLLAPGTQYIYSNFGYGLLGVIAARHAGMDFESLVMSRICKPLGMESTRVALTPDLRLHATPGHDQKLARVRNWTLPATFAAAGAFRSTANDLLRFLEAAMAVKRTSLSAAFAEMLRVQRPADQPNTNAAAGWFVTRSHGDSLIWKDGGTLGYASFLGYSTVNHQGAVLLANAITGDLPDLGKHLLNTDFPPPR